MNADENEPEERELTRRNLSHEAVGGEGIWGKSQKNHCQTEGDKNFSWAGRFHGRKSYGDLPLSLGNVNRKSGFSKKLSILGGHYFIHFCNLCKKEVDVFFIFDCPDTAK